MPGHLFILHGDLRRLACDAIVLPCDDRFRITDVWAPLLPSELTTAPGRSNWLQLPKTNAVGPTIRLSQGERRHVLAVATVHAGMTLDTMVDRLLLGIDEVSKGLVARGGRSLPLIGLPLVGTGEGGLSGRRGEVVDALLPRLSNAATSGSFDVALVLWDRRDFAAVQARRTEADWTALPKSLVSEADRLGGMAANGQLSLFVGAGACKPVGLPDWRGLLEQLAQSASLQSDWVEEDLIDAATPIVDKLGPRFDSEVARLLTTTEHAMAHALLAGLGVGQIVTTNFDRCMELALGGVRGDDNYRVLTRQLAGGDQPWLLKLHGDIALPGSLVLSRAHYKKHEDEYRAVRGVVQSLMLTSHLLFVGFSMTDNAFLKMAEAVSRVRRDAAGAVAGMLPRAGTALALTKADIRTPRLEEDLAFLPMLADGDSAEAARNLEIFLDRLAWAAARSLDVSAEYLLDDRYQSGLNGPDLALRTALTRMQNAISDEAMRSAGWPTIQAAFKRLGAEPPTNTGP